MANAPILSMTDIAMAKFMGVDIPPPGAKKISIEVDSRCDGMVVAGTYVEVGKRGYEIYDVHFEHFEKLVEDPEKLRFAREQYERDMEEAELVKAGKADWRKQYDPSVEAAFRDMFKRDPLPFLSVELVDTKKKAA